MKRQIVSAALGGLLAGLLAGAGTGFLVSKHMMSVAAKEVREGQYGFINPLLECEIGKSPTGSDLTAFEPAVRSLIGNEIRSNKAQSISVYFRDLDTGRWFSIGDREQFMPASLLKVAVMTAYLKLAEQQPEIMKKKLKFTGDPVWKRQVIKPVDTLEAGRTYSVEDLIYRMIAYSDNDSVRLLLSNDARNSFQKTFIDLGLRPPGPVEEDYVMTIDDYATFFRVLFNGSYLSKEMSNRALYLLSQSYFRGGIVAGVPAGVAVSHKFGERDTDRERQFHDCGIVYYPGRPYLLCIMSRGGEMADLVSSVQDISGLAFSSVDREMKSSEKQ